MGRDASFLQEYELISHTNAATPSNLALPASHRRRDQSNHGIWKPLLHFVIGNPGMIIALLLGTAGAFACFAFTYWLSLQVFFCPAWTYECEVKSPVRFFVERLGLVQGFVSSIYGICIGGIAYTSFQIAETTIWPALGQYCLTLKGIDRFLAHARGSLASFPYAVWHSRERTHFTAVIVVCMIGVLLHANSAVVGWAFTVMPVHTIMKSNHTQGGGEGFGFSQSNPPEPVNGEVQWAYNLFSSCRHTYPSYLAAVYRSTSQSIEMLPDLRDYLIDRTNFSSIGNFTVKAVQVNKSINCYAEPIEVIDAGDAAYTVATNLSNSYSRQNEVLLRLSANGFTTWVDSYQRVSDTRAVTKLMFAALNGTIQGGYQNNVLQEICATALGQSTCSGVSTLACDVDIDLVPGKACHGLCAESDPVTLTTLDQLRQVIGNTDLSSVAVSLAAVPTQFGPYIVGAQPMYTYTFSFENASLGLPVAYSDISSAGNFNLEGGLSYTQANLTHFIDVAVGAMAVAIPKGWTSGWTIVDSTLQLPRLYTPRSFALLAPPAIALVSVLVLALLSVLMHKRAGIGQIRLAWTSELLLSLRRGDIMAVVEKASSQDDPREFLERERLRYGWTSSIEEGLGTEASVTLFRTF